MPGHVVHLFVANELVRGTTLGCQGDSNRPAGPTLLDDLGILDPAAFVAGNLAPDAVHARPGYERRFKKYAHLKEGLTDRDLAANLHQEVFGGRLRQFAVTTARLADPGRRSFYWGYLTHILVDYWFIRHVLDTIYRSKAAGLYGHDETQVSARDILDEYAAMDHLVSGWFSGLPALRQTLTQAGSWAVEDYVSRHEVQASRQWVLDRLALPPPDPGPPGCCTASELASHLRQATAATRTFLLECQSSQDLACLPPGHQQSHPQED